MEKDNKEGKNKPSQEDMDHLMNELGELAKMQNNKTEMLLFESSLSILLNVNTSGSINPFSQTEINKVKETFLKIYDKYDNTK